MVSKRKMQNIKELSIMTNATEAIKETAIAQAVENTVAPGYTAIPDPIEAEPVEAEAISLDDAIAQVNDLIGLIQSDLDKAVSHEWKHAAKKYSKAIAVKQSEAYALRDTIGDDGVALDAAIKSVEAIALESSDLLVEAANAKPTESERYGAIALWGKGALIDDPKFNSNQLPMDTLGYNLLRLTRQTPQGQVSVLFKSTASAVSSDREVGLKPLGLITANGIRKFSDLPNNQETRSIISKAEGVWCPNLKLANKQRNLAAREEHVNKEFKNAGFTLADLQG